MPLASHFEFILVAYAAAFVILSALILWVIFDYRALKRTLAGLADEGVARRSDTARSPL